MRINPAQYGGKGKKKGSGRTTEKRSKGVIRALDGHEGGQWLVL